MILISLFGNVLFWFTLIAFLAISFFTESKELYTVGPVVTLLVFLSCFYLFGGKADCIKILHLIYVNWLSVIFYTILYLLVGTIWSFIKWYFFLLRVKKEIDSNNYYNKSKPEAVDHRDRISSWIIYWPMSLLYNVITDPISKAVSFIFEKVKGSYDNMANKIFDEVENKKS